MSFNQQQDLAMPVSPTRVAAAFTAAMQRVYLWMALGLMLTTAVSLLVSTNEMLLSLIFGNRFVFIGLIVGELLLVIAISAVTARLSVSTGLALFFLYAAVNGATLSVIFLAYSLGTVVLAFGSTALLFGIMSVIGYTTKEDLTRWGGILFMGLIGLIIASVANMFFASTALDWIITYAGIGLFLALTVYDTNRIKAMTYSAVMQGESQVAGRVGVLGALRLYLDFINLFLLMLRLFGGRRR